EIVEKLGRLCAGRAAVFDQLVEARAVSIEELLVVAHLDAQRQAVLEMTVEVDEMRIDVVEQRTPGLQTQCNGEAAAERFDVPPRCVSLRIGARCETSQRLPPAHFNGGLIVFS